MANDDKEIELSIVSSTLTPASDERQPDQCSFCGKQAGQVNCLLAGPGVAICDACIERYKAAMAEAISDGPADRA